MNKFYFEAVDNAGKKFSGYVMAATEDTAREKIKEKRLALLWLEQYDEKKRNLAKTQYDFRGIDNNGDPINGIVDAATEYEAYARLVKEYSLDVEYLVLSDLPLPEKLQQQEQGISLALQEQIALRGDPIKEKKQAIKKKVTGGIVTLSKKEQAELEFYQEKIATISADVMAMVEADSQFLDKEKRREIVERINLLMRLRRSNAIDHLRALVRKLLQQVEDDALFLKLEKLSVEQQEELLARKAKFDEYSHGLNKSINANLAQIQSSFAPIDSELMKKAVLATDPIGEIGRIFYWTMLSLFGLLMTFWVVSAAQLFFGMGQKWTLFAFYSPTLWLLTVVAMVFSAGLAPIAFSRDKTPWEKRGILAVISVVVFAAIAFEFPAIFWWTR